MKKLINAPGDVVGEALDGLTRTAAGVARLAGSTTAVGAAGTGAAGTAHVRARLGRSSCLGDRVLGRPDPGAQAVAVWPAAVAVAVRR